MKKEFAFSVSSIFFGRVISVLKRLSCPGPGCSKLATWLVNVSLKFQTLISQIRHYFMLKKCESIFHFFNKKYQCTVKPAYVVTSIKGSPALSSHLF